MLESTNHGQEEGQVRAYYPETKVQGQEEGEIFWEEGSVGVFQTAVGSEIGPLLATGLCGVQRVH